MPDITIPPENVTLLPETFMAVALEDIHASDFVAIQIQPFGEFEVSSWHRAFGLPTAGMALHNAVKGEQVECAYRAHFEITVKQANLNPDVCVIEPVNINTPGLKAGERIEAGNFVYIDDKGKV